MLSLKKLRFKAIGRLVEEQTIDFTKLGNLIQVDGNNMNTGGSSGAGKSTVFKALDFLFGLNDNVSNATLQSRLTEETIWVEGTFDLDGKPLVVTRSKKLSVDFDGVVTTGSSKITEEKLDEILAMERSVFRPMLHKRQREGGFFLAFTPAKMNQFLVNCLGLSAETVKLEKVEKKLTEVEKKQKEVSSQLESAKTGLGATQVAISTLGEAPVKEIDQAQILSLKAAMEASASTLQGIQDKQKSEHDALSTTIAALKASQKEELTAFEATRPKTELKTYDNSKKKALESENAAIAEKMAVIDRTERSRSASVKESISSLKIQKANLAGTVAQAGSIKDEARKAALQIKKIRESLCPTCEQGWVTESAKKEEAALLERIKKFKEMIAQGEQAALEIQSVDAQLAALEPTKEYCAPLEYTDLSMKRDQNQELIRAENNNEKDFNSQQNYLAQVKNNEFMDLHKALTTKHSAALEVLTKEQSALNNKHSADREQFRNQAESDRSAFNSAVAKLKAYEDARTRYEGSVASLKAQEASYNEKVSELTVLNKALTDDIAVLADLKRAVKSYISCSFDDALATISETATRLIRSIPNMANATVQIEGTRETGEGKVKEEVNAIIHMDGEEGVPIKSLCGGELSAVDLAVDLAVIELIENKTNKGIDIIILDEPFTGLDTVCIEMALEMLKSASANKRIIIVDHNPVIQQMVTDKLVVVRDGLLSNIHGAA